MKMMAVFSEGFELKVSINNTIKSISNLKEELTRFKID